jgi:hypothetical protein
VIRRYAYAAAFLLLPSVLVAQRGGKTRSTEDMFGKQDKPQGALFRIRDIEDLSPIRRLIDKRKDIKLSDAQMDALKKSDDALKQKNEAHFKALDSLVRAMKPPLNMTPEAAARIDDARWGVGEAMKAVDENYSAAAKEAVAALEPEQQTRANEVLAQLKEDADKFRREKLGGGRGRRG